MSQLTEAEAIRSHRTRLVRREWLRLLEKYVAPGPLTILMQVPH